MACAGDCRKQVHRFNGRTTTIDKSNAAAPDLTAEEASTILKEDLGVEHPDTKLQGCVADACDCVRLEGEVPLWSEWVKYTIPEVFTRVIDQPAGGPCTYTFSGTYEVSASIYTGYCMRRSTAM